ncbi:MAG TPA: LacI family DNA-binding transcriptional regulator, partial [Pseudonocardia sp.]|nr:LacI family DNA-binding transcriptional regulator [Pseudonocardia sp.]
MTIRDVAARAGVSAATVSRVFSRPESVTVETRRRVLTAADALRYTPHPVARSLARGNTGNLGLVVPDMAVAFCAVVTKAVSHRARRDGYALFVADSDDPSARLAADGVRSAHAMAKQVDGLLLLSPTTDDDDLRALADAVPLVVINRDLAG